MSIFESVDWVASLAIAICLVVILAIVNARLKLALLRREANQLSQDVQRLTMWAEERRFRQLDSVPKKDGRAQVKPGSDCCAGGRQHNFAQLFFCFIETLFRGVVIFSTVTNSVMTRVIRFIAGLLVLVQFAFAASEARAENRVALVIGNAGYQAGALKTAANDAGLIAQTLQAAGFDVVGARDLDQDSLRRGLHDFLDKASASGPDTVGFVYFSGYGLQFEGENYLVPIDAKIARDTDVPAEAVRLSDYTRPLAALGLKASIVVVDSARVNPFAKSGQPLAGGLALVEAEPAMLIAFNATPGTAIADNPGPYGAYAQALAEMIREAGLSLADVFDRTRLRVNERTKGGEVPWYTSRVDASVVFFERTTDAPPPAASAEQAQSLRSRPIRELDAQQAYLEALNRDTLQGYLDFLAVYPDDPMAKRVRAIVAVRREAITWRQTRLVNTPQAYWSYLGRYPHGPHAVDARRRLTYFTAAQELPPSFSFIEYDVPPPPPEETVYLDQPVLVFDDPIYAFPSPPPLPIFFLPPAPPELIDLPPPPPPIAVFVLPVPIYVPVPIWCHPPAFVASPPNNVIFANVHNRVVINNTTSIATITDPAGKTTTLRQQPPAAPSGSTARAAAQSALAPALPPSVAQKAAAIRKQTPSADGNQFGPSERGPVQQGQPSEQSRPAQLLPGMRGQPLPPTGGTSSTGGVQINQPTQPGKPSTRQPSGQPLPGTKGQPLPSTGGAASTGGAINPPTPLGQSATRQPSGQPLPGTKPLPSTEGAARGAHINQPTPQQRSKHPSPPPQAMRPPSPLPQVMRAPSQPPQAMRPPSSPSLIMRAPSPPPQAMRPPSPPPQVMRAPSQPPQAMRPPPSSPSLIMRAPSPPPPQAMRPPSPPPAAARVAPRPHN